MGGIYHKGQPYSGQMVVDTDLSKVSNNPLKNRAVTGLVDDVIAPVEGANASQAYSAGDELILNNLLYKANQAIQQGTAFNPESGGNIDLAGSIAEQLKALFDGESLLKFEQLTDIASLNVSYISEGMRLYLYGSNAFAVPEAKSGLLIDVTKNSVVSYQIAINQDGSAIYMRIKTTSAWSTTSPYGWKQIYGTSVANTPITTTDTAITMANTSKYLVKNGWCFAQVNYKISDTNVHDNAFNLPKPDTSLSEGYLYFYSSNLSGDTGSIRISGSTGGVRIQAGTANVNVFTAISYPIA